MNAGKIVQTGTPQEIYEFPNSKFVSDFVGSVNMFEGVVIEDEPNMSESNPTKRARGSISATGISCPPGARVWVAVRPRKSRLPATSRWKMTIGSSVLSSKSPIWAICPSICAPRHGQIVKGDPAQSGSLRRANACSGMTKSI